MADAKRIYSELRPSLLRSGTLLAALLLVMAAAGVYNSRMSQSRQYAEQQFQGLVSDYRTAVESEQILRTEAARFIQLSKQGFIGPEPRLQWIEAVRDTAARAGLVTSRYELEPRKPAPTMTPTGSYQLFASRMRLQLELRHEGDLLKFLNLLETRHAGLFELSACALHNTRDDGVISLQESNVNAECDLRWYSLDSADATPAEDLQ